MKQNRLPRTYHFEVAKFFIAAFLLFFNASCGNNTSRENTSTQAQAIVLMIKNEQQFKTIIESSGDRLLVFDFYADWCPPCKKLSTILEEVAKENQDKAAFYKINVDQNQFLARSFRVTGIPYVVFVLNKTTVHALPGLRSKDTYVRVIKHFSHIGGKIRSEMPTYTARAYLAGSSTF